MSYKDPKDLLDITGNESEEEITLIALHDIAKENKELSALLSKAEAVLREYEKEENWGEVKLMAGYEFDTRWLNEEPGFTQAQAYFKENKR